MIVGVDEVGRGCWAGPVAAGAVLLGTPIAGLADSKVLTRLQRERLDIQIRENALSFGVGWASVDEIDALGLTEAVRLAMQRAFEQVRGVYKRIVIDGNYNYLKEYPLSETLIDADASIPAVSAASIIAKVARDKHMAELGEQFPGYGFERHVGYGTVAHRAAIQALGLTNLHRRSWKPIQALL
jgi:ribonuclease HII